MRQHYYNLNTRRNYASHPTVIYCALAANRIFLWIILWSFKSEHNCSIGDVRCLQNIFRTRLRSKHFVLFSKKNSLVYQHQNFETVRPIKFLDMGQGTAMPCNVMNLAFLMRRSLEHPVFPTGFGHKSTCRLYLWTRYSWAPRVRFPQSMS